MKVKHCALNEPVIAKPSDKYNFSDSERDQYIEEINRAIRKDIRLNDIRYAESMRLAGELVYR